MPEIILNGKYTDSLSNKNIFGSFIESGFGRQVPGMWSEMIFNRSFRVVPEYNNNTWCWLGLDKDHYTSDAPFWHSGYEEFDWVIDENTRYHRTLGTETHKGTSSLVLIARDGKGGKISQGGIHLEAGRDYNFRLFMGVSTWRSDPGLNGFGSSEHTLKSRPVKVSIGDNEIVIEASGVAREHKFDFTAKTTGVFTITISYEWDGDLILAYSSLMPADNIKGWRRDIVEKLREAAPPVVRFPGGCFTSFFNWQASIGPRDEREPQISYYWGGMEENDVGLREFCELAELCGFEPQICFNMMTSTPFNARCMVEYLNAPSDVGYGRLRMLDGHEKPFNVKYFECDNEAGRKWTPVQYAQKCVDFSREMRLVSPDAIFMMETYSYSFESVPYMLDIAGGDINYIIQRNGSPENVARYLGVLREYNEKSGNHVRICDTEWLASCHSPEPFDDPDIPTKYHWDGRIYNDPKHVLSRFQISWNYAVNGAHRLLDYISYGGEFTLANFNNMTNTWGQNILEGSKDSAWLSCMGEVFAFFHRNFIPCFASVAEVDDPLVFALFTRSEDGKEQLYVINHKSGECEITIPDRFTRAADGIAAPNRLSSITEKECPVARTNPDVNGGKVVLSALSVVVFE